MLPDDRVELLAIVPLPIPAEALIVRLVLGPKLRPQPRARLLPSRAPGPPAREPGTAHPHTLAACLSCLRRKSHGQFRGPERRNAFRLPDHHDVELMDERGRVLARGRLPEGVAGMARLHELIGEQRARQPMMRRW